MITCSNGLLTRQVRLIGQQFPATDKPASLNIFKRGLNVREPIYGLYPRVLKGQCQVTAGKMLQGILPGPGTIPSSVFLSELSNPFDVIGMGVDKYTAMLWGCSNLSQKMRRVWAYSIFLELDRGCHRVFPPVLLALNT